MGLLGKLFGGGSEDSSEAVSATCLDCGSELGEGDSNYCEDCASEGSLGPRYRCGVIYEEGEDT